MRITLVNPPKTDVGLAELAPPLGLLRLAGIARRQGVEPVVCDLNLLWQLDPRMRESFYDTATDLLRETGAGAYAFTSMCVDSHVALELAKRLKARDAGIITIFGGPHFSSIAEEIKSRFPWVDYVIRGEGENAFARLMTCLKKTDQYLSPILGDDIQLPGFPALPGAAQSEPEAALCYDLVDLCGYFALNPRRMADFESGRGCRFKCAFCYSPSHYSAVRAFDMSAVLNELAYLESLGFKRFALADDNFVNFPNHALAFCEALYSKRLTLRWQCYATFPQITEKLVAAMSESGCDQIFSGIDTVGKATQRVFHKAFLPSEDSYRRKLDMLVEHGITPTCAFLLCPPSHPGGRDLEATLRAALTARLRGAKVRLNTLTLYNGTPATLGRVGLLEPDDLKTRLMLDVPAVVEDNRFASANPDLFPFHSRYVGGDEWHTFLQLAHCLSSLVDTYPTTLDVLWEDRGISPIAVAQKVLLSVGTICKLPKRERRPTEQIAAYEILEGLAFEPREARALEAENPFEGSYASKYSEECREP